MSDILDKINASKILEIADRKSKVSLAELKARAIDRADARPFFSAIENKYRQQEIAIIAEIKKASPSKGVIRPNFHPSEIAQAYQQAGATCLSVLTDEIYFQGSLDYLKEVKASVSLPILRKDFMLDEYQIYEARAWEADAILLIAASLTQSQLEDLEGLSHSLGMSVLVELHDESELAKCQQLTSPLFGVNNRNLRSFEVNLQQTLTLLPFLSDKIVVCESGIHSHQDIELMQEHGVHAFLVGESLMRQENIEQALNNLITGNK